MASSCDRVSPSLTAYARAAEMLGSGRLVAFPTETVYGLGADATDPAAVAALFAAKDRPASNPMIVHVADAAAADRVGTLDGTAARLAAALWPGPLTVVVPRRPTTAVVAAVSANLDSIAVRVPGHPVAQGVLRAVARPIVAPSANRSGTVSPTTADHVEESLGGRIDLLIDGGACPVGLGSTVVACLPGVFRLLRPGAITAERVEAAAGCALGGEAALGGAALAPGQMASHYAPRRPVRLGAVDAAPDEAVLAFGPDDDLPGGRMRLNLSQTGDFAEAAHNLYAMLRALDRPDVRAIAVMPIPATGLGVALNDRLARAAAPRPSEAGPHAGVSEP